MVKLKSAIIFLVISAFLFIFVYQVYGLTKSQEEALEIIGNPESTSTQLEKAVLEFQDVQIPEELVVQGFLLLKDRINAYDLEDVELFKHYVRITDQWRNLEAIDRIFMQIASSEDLYLNALMVYAIKDHPRQNKALHLYNFLINLMFIDEEKLEDAFEFAKNKPEETRQMLVVLGLEDVDQIKDAELGDTLIKTLQLIALEELKTSMLEYSADEVLLGLINALRSPYPEVRQASQEALNGKLLKRNTAVWGLVDEVYADLPKDDSLRFFIEEKRLEIDLYEIFQNLWNLESDVYMSEVGTDREKSEVQKRMQTARAQVMQYLNRTDAHSVSILLIAISTHLNLFRYDHKAMADSFLRQNINRIMASMLFVLENYKATRLQFAALNIIDRYLLKTGILVEYLSEARSDSAELEREWKISEALRFRLKNAIEAIAFSEDSELTYQARTMHDLMFKEGITGKEVDSLKAFSFIDSVANKIAFYGPEVFAENLNLGSYDVNTLYLLITSLDRSGSLEEVEVQRLAMWIKSFSAVIIYQGGQLTPRRQQLLKRSMEIILKHGKEALFGHLDTPLIALVKEVFGQDQAIKTFGRDAYEAAFKRSHPTKEGPSLELPSAPGDIAAIDLKADTLAARVLAEDGLTAEERLLERQARGPEEEAKKALEARGEAYGKKKPGEAAKK
ncbi:MAG: hypothetical protein ABIA04_02535 [Pseudomonadota bacterium]